MKKTPLYDLHREAGAKLIDFSGWEMPVQYSSIITEHQAVREQAGLFDVSHMGEFVVSGGDALANLQKLVTNNVARLDLGQVIYTPMCREDGGILDDLLIYHLAAEKYMLVVNASNIEKDFQWIEDHLSGEAEIKNLSNELSLLALQGPEAANIMKKLSDIELDKLNYYCFTKGKVAGIEINVSRTGYTGELGYELYCDSKQVIKLWRELMSAGEEYNLLAAGLGARDTLRLEKAYCLYGNDIDESRHPLEAGLSWTVKLNKDNFIGKESILKYQTEGFTERLVGFKLLERGIPRHGYQIMVNKKAVGEVSSGSYSPTLGENIGLAYLDKEYASIGQEIQIIIRKKPVKGIVVKTPFV